MDKNSLKTHLSNLGFVLTDEWRDQFQALVKGEKKIWIGNFLLDDEKHEDSYPFLETSSMEDINCYLETGQLVIGAERMIRLSLLTPIENFCIEPGEKLYLWGNVFFKPGMYTYQRATGMYVVLKIIGENIIKNKLKDFEGMFEAQEIGWIKKSDEWVTLLQE